MPSRTQVVCSCLFSGIFSFWLVKTALELWDCCYFSHATVAFLVALCQGLIIAKALPKKKKSLQGKYILITGCDTGFGHALARRLDAKGANVFAGCLLKSKGGEGVKSLEKSCKNVKTLQLDVTNENDIRVAVDEISGVVGASGLYAVVNNAGVSSFGDIELCTMATYQKMFDVNVLGVIRVVKTVLPLLRLSKGRVVTITSGLGRCCHAGRSSYGASKYAVEAISDCLRYEVAKFGIQTSTVTPGNFLGATSIVTQDMMQRQADEMWEAAPEDIKATYGKEYLQANVDAIASYLGKGTRDMGPVLDAYEAALSDVEPRIRYYATDLYWTVKIYVATHLPEAVFEYFYI